jgi:hypothetical protein
MPLREIEMTQTFRRSFAQTLTALAWRNALAVERKARTASSLAATYPERAEAFRGVESAALMQLFRIMAHGPETELDAGAAGVPSLARFQGHISVVISKKEKYERRK